MHHVRIFFVEKLKKYFKQYGTVQDAVVMKDPVSKRSRGFGFITFVEVASVDNALDHEPHTIDSRKVYFAAKFERDVCTTRLDLWEHLLPSTRRFHFLFY